MNKNLHNSEKIWINGKIATMDPNVESPYGMLENHIIGVKNGSISALLPASEVDLTDFRGEIIDAHDKLLTPGLIDSHTHLIYGGQRAGEFTQRLQGVSYAEIARRGGGILSTVVATRNLEEDQLVEVSRPRLEALIADGVTTVEIKSGYGLTLKDELKMLRAAGKLATGYPLRLRRTLLAAHSVPPEFKNSPERYVDLVCNEIIPLTAAKNLAEAVDVFCESIAFSLKHCEQIFTAAQKAGLGIKAHAEQLSNSHASALAASYKAWSVDHLEYLDEAGVAALQKSGTVATLLPGAFYFLGETQKPPVELLRKYRVPMALASDLNPGSSPLASLRLMLNMSCILFSLTPEEALKGVTLHASSALGIGEVTGILSVGKAADMLLWDLDDPAQLAYQFGEQSLHQRIFAGEVSDV
jgi:imidazolonepropionase